MEEKLATALWEGQIARLVEDNEVEPSEIICQFAQLPSLGFGDPLPPDALSVFRYRSILSSVHNPRAGEGYGLGNLTCDARRRAVHWGARQRRQRVTGTAKQASGRPEQQAPKG